MDLLTVVNHELGHILDFDHNASGLMDENLETGARKLIAVEQADVTGVSDTAVNSPESPSITFGVAEASALSHKENPKTKQKQQEFVDISYFDEHFGAFKHLKSEPGPVDSPEFLIFTHEKSNDDEDEDELYLLKQDSEENEKLEVLTEKEAEAEETSIEASDLIDWNVLED